MGNRVPLNARVEEDVCDAFREYTVEQKGQFRGEFGRLVERAMREYIERDRLARIDERLEQIETRQDEILRLLRNTDTPLSTDRPHSHTDRFAGLNELNPQVREGVMKTIEASLTRLTNRTSKPRFTKRGGRTNER